MKKLLLIGLIGLLAILGSFAIACSDDDDDTDADPTAAQPTEGPTEAPENTQTSAEGDVCSDLASLDTSLTALSTALSDPNSTVGDVRTAEAAVEASFVDLQTSATAVAEERVAALDAAQTDLQTAMAGVPDTATLEEAVTALQPQVDALAGAATSALSDLGC